MRNSDRLRRRRPPTPSATPERRRVFPQMERRMESYGRPKTPVLPCCMPMTRRTLHTSCTTATRLPVDATNSAPAISSLCPQSLTARYTSAPQTASASSACCTESSPPASRLRPNLFRCLLLPQRAKGDGITQLFYRRDAVLKIPACGFTHHIDGAGLKGYRDDFSCSLVRFEAHAATARQGYADHDFELRHIPVPSDRRSTRVLGDHCFYQLLWKNGGECCRFVAERMQEFRQGRRAAGFAGRKIVFK